MGHPPAAPAGLPARPGGHASTRYRAVPARSAAARSCAAREAHPPLDTMKQADLRTAIEIVAAGRAQTTIAVTAVHAPGRAPTPRCAAPAGTLRLDTAIARQVIARLRPYRVSVRPGVRPPFALVGLVDPAQL